MGTILPTTGSAGPVGGNIVGGLGSIQNTGNTTNIIQNSSSLAIDWQSYNLNRNDIVNYLQPGRSSIALNRILSSSPSQINGQINANGHVILVNPNGIFFGSSANINVGGLIATGLDISPTDFMNGNYLFKEVSDTDGVIINGGIITASLGGDVTLLGKQVKNEGLISANLGSVNLAAGKEAVLTFDAEGLVGIKITKAILQDELGVDPAVLNSGEIDAQSGHILLTASQSQDVFSQAVNTGNINQATSVVVNEDGTFTLGAGADVVNSGTISASTGDNLVNAGRVVALGENVTSSGAILADSRHGDAGEIELHSVEKTILNDGSVTTAISDESKGGVIKVLGDKVGLFDTASVNTTGYGNGGTILLGGDYQGKNRLVRNATVTYVGKDTSINTSSMYSGNGGKIIVWSDDTTRYYGNIQNHGGNVYGNGGFVEISGKEYLDFNGDVNLGSDTGVVGTLLLDPRNIRVLSLGSDLATATLAFDTNSTGTSDINATSIETLLASGNVQLEARADILVDEAISVASGNTSSLTMLAGDDIEINNKITLGSGDLTLTANVGSCGTNGCTSSGLVSDGTNLRIGADLSTNGGNIDLSGNNIVLLGSSANHGIDTGSGSGNIIFTGDVVSSSTSNPNSLTLTAGTGDITFNNNIGTATSDNLGGLTVNSANNVALNQVRTGTGGIDITANTANLFSNLRTDQDISTAAINLDADVVLNNNVRFFTQNGSVTVTGDVNGTDFSLVFDLGVGDLNLNGAIGNTQRLGLFQINNAGDVSLGTAGVNGGFRASSVNIAQANSFTTNSFDINTVQSNVTGNVMINADTTLTLAGINTTGGTVTGESAGRNAGSVNLAAQDIIVGTIKSIGGDASGTTDHSGGNGGGSYYCCDG